MITEKQKSDLFPICFSIVTVTAFILVLVVPGSREVFKAMTSTHPFTMGFVKFAFLATVGELIAIRLQTKRWLLPAGIFAKFVVWGLFGVLIALMFKIFAGGVGLLLANGILPGKGIPVWAAFLTSLLMNSTFGIALMSSHRVTDTIIVLACEKKKITVENIVASIDFKALIGFTIMKTIPLFWIPAHTIAFSLPGEYQIVTAAFLSIVLGIFLSLKKN
jgi:Mpv17 / PMP22 family.